MRIYRISKALDYTADMLAYAREASSAMWRAVTKFRNRFGEKTLDSVENYGEYLQWLGTYFREMSYEEMFSRVVDCGKYGKREISVVHCDYDAFKKNSRSVCRVNRSQVSNPSSSVDITIVSLMLHMKSENSGVNAILHELIHIFDPKVVKNIDGTGGYGIGADQDFKIGLERGNEMGLSHYQYLTSPVEQDANMRQIARMRVNDLINRHRDDLEAIKHGISIMVPVYAPEKAFYNGKNMWRRYLQTVWDEYSKIV